MVERDAHRPRVDRAHDARVADELRAIALELAREERARLAAEVRAGLEVDDVAKAVRDEAAVEHDVDDAPLVLARQCPFAVRVRMRAIEEPPAARIAQRARNDRLHALRRRPRRDRARRLRCRARRRSAVVRCPRGARPMRRCRRRQPARAGGARRCRSPPRSPSAQSKRNVSTFDGGWLGAGSDGGGAGIRQCNGSRISDAGEVVAA